MRVRLHDFEKALDTINLIIMFDYHFGIIIFHFPLLTIKTFLASHNRYQVSRHVKFLEKKLVTTRAMTSFSEQGVRTARAKENGIWEY